ncbi:uncharacterized protein MELLADRAFT_105908 [Melampsora larici-populina 98AG31]|uniref:Ribosomal protein S5 domain 2-like protein n=1 Tax=Melampsora larici-populina (strain 98AG31 / pathotype 3-4-7) TaxID=747676 RepID=F4RJQ9_MELLP|nr:uncharacterized protein MELLADRAFT_105908 [Melampsora larici-populina 98AG31]EGG07355.1 hypothetical protein MELLADRAFT_105908 [Melampsora larici-populina 98AG31]
MSPHPSIKLSSNLIRSTLLKPKPTTNQTKPLNRQSSSFIPGRSSSSSLEEKHTIVPKPTSPNWFTTHPALSDSLSELDSLIKRSRETLYESSVLKRFSAPATFAGTGVRLKWLKWRMEEEIKKSVTSNEEENKIYKTLWSSSPSWHDFDVISTILQGNEGRSLRMIEYTVTLNKLNEIKSLKKYLLFLEFSNLSNRTHASKIQSLNQEINQVLLKFIKPDRIRKSIKNEEFGRDRLGRFYGIGKKKEILQTIFLTSSLGHYNIHLLAHGGGKMGQAAAVSHALANALMNALQDSAKTDSTAQERHARKVLSKSQLTLRDPRVVERKKTGKPGAKSSYRWVKR